MNISTGGPHILLFERDQQLAAILTSELQLAGYECHAARTAVEVFDAIARYPVRLVLVNLAQAAAARREFWVALDTQRRGRGVQVLTFHCTNIGAYGPSLEDPEEHSQSMMADMEVDGMQGIMNMINAIRSRIAVSNTSAMQKPLAPSAPVPQQTILQPQQETAQPSGAFSALLSDNNTNKLPSITTPIYAVQPTNGTTPSTPAYVNQNALTNPPTPLPSFTPPEMPRAAVGNHTDKIRAVIYPNQKSWNTPRNDNQANMNGNGQTYAIRENTPSAQYPAYTSQSPSQSFERTQENEDERRWQRGTRAMPVSPSESGLEQLSRMLQERQSTAQNAVQHEQQYEQNIQSLLETTLPQSRVRPSEQRQNPASQRPLRASPIQDMPTERSTTDITGNTAYPNASQYTAPQPLMSISGSAPASVTPTPSERTASYTTQPELQNSVAATRKPVTAEPAPARTDTLPDNDSDEALLEKIQAMIQAQQAQLQAQQMQQAAVEQPVQPAPQVKTQAAPAPQQMQVPPPVQPAQQPQQGRIQQTAPQAPAGQAQYVQRPQPPAQSAAAQQATQEPLKAAEPQTNSLNQQALLDLLTEHPDDALDTQDRRVAPDNELLLDIVQSLPPMPAPPPQPQPQVLNGRATRSLGSVLLEGHLVPQNRLEVAQGIQRMLRGVDMNYRLGEILLMFKLLTPDQLLAASLVSYGLITPVQITALGRIRQELHAIGLEYDLENLLVLFRILTSEQLREVRASWSS